MNPSAASEGSEVVEYEDKPLRIFPVDRRALERIHPHESVNEPDLEAFVRSFREKGLFYKPILIDGESGTILDGTHRWAGLRKLGAKEAPVIQFDYFGNDEISVGTWYPVAQAPPEDVTEFLREAGYELEQTAPVDYEHNPPDQAHYIGPDARYRVEGNPVDLFLELEREFEFQYAQRAGQLPEFADDGFVGFYRSPPDKQDVVDIARKGEAVPPKYTCHRFPFKYPHIMTPFEELVPDG